MFVDEDARRRAAWMRERAEEMEAGRRVVPLTWQQSHEIGSILAEAVRVANTKGAPAGFNYAVSHGIRGMPLQDFARSLAQTELANGRVVPGFRWPKDK